MSTNPRIQLKFIAAALTTIQLGCTPNSALPPGQPENHKSDVPVVHVYRLDGSFLEDGDNESLKPPANSFRGWPILEKKSVISRRLAGELSAALHDRSNFGGEKAASFWPGMGISIAEDDNQIDVLVCLKCQRIRIYTKRGNEEEQCLSGPGQQEFSRLYAEAFPGQSSNDSAK